ncbi:MAG: deoxynucleoside kinase [Deltaproteobacteria bacterium]|nr:deoxynucleoside kinase [Deltaproteobacteria bacterium]
MKNGPKYIAIEGPIGVGKTTLAKLLAKHFDGRLVLEKAEENPFLERFYRDRKKYAFQTQLYFLLSRYKQQQELRQFYLFSKVTITDYTFLKDKIFAHLNLDGDELSLYEQIYSLLNKRVIVPDLVIYLRARTDVLLKRIRERGIKYEKEISQKYLKELLEVYNNTFFHYSSSPLLVVETSEIDFVKNESDLNDLVKEIRGMKKGTWYFVPLGSK